MSALLKVKNIPLLTCKQFIDDVFLEADEKLDDVLSPYTGDVIGYVPNGSKDLVEQAVKASKSASLTWMKKTFKERSQYLFNYRNLLIENIDDISTTAALESGKTIGEAKAEVLKGIEVVEYALSLQNKVHNVGSLEVSGGVSCKTMRVPLGVTVGITPFNFPAMVPMWLFPISLACGNTFIWKPSEKVPLTAHKLTLLMKQSGFPKGVFQTVYGTKDTVNFLIESEDTKAISFVGSSAVAKQVYTKSSSMGKRSLCLGGAKNHIILVSDADEEVTIGGISDSFTGCAGQRCMAASVLLAVGDTQKLIDKVVKKAESIKLMSNMGAIIDKSSLERIKGIIENAKKEGAKILLDGTNVTSPSGCEGGYWIGPTIIDHATEDMECVKTEIFGPVLTICRVNSLDEAIERENRHNYGNATSVFTSSGSVAEFVAANASNGMIGVNIGVPVPREPFSFGGRKDSKFGHGDITGDGCLDFWTDLKKITTKWKKIDSQNWMS